MPGPYCKHFLEKCGHAGMNAMLAGFDDKSAYAQCIFAFHSGKEGDDVITFVGRTEGSIVPARATCTACATIFSKSFNVQSVNSSSSKLSRKR